MSESLPDATDIPRVSSLLILLCVLWQMAYYSDFIRIFLVDKYEFAVLNLITVERYSTKCISDPLRCENLTDALYPTLPAMIV